MPKAIFHTQKIDQEIVKKIDKFVLRNKYHGVANRSDAISLFIARGIQDTDDYLEIKARYHDLVDAVKDIKNVKTTEDSVAWQKRVSGIINEKLQKEDNET